MDNCYLVMDLMEGGDLMDKIQQVQEHTEGDARKFNAEVLNAVRELYDLGIVHHNIKLQKYTIIRDFSHNGIELTLALNY
jgi:serine/threonine protein kinase